MNERLRNNAVLHLAKATLVGIYNLFIFWMFNLAFGSNHYILALFIGIVFLILTFISLCQSIFFIRDMMRANKK